MNKNNENFGNKVMHGMIVGKHILKGGVRQNPSAQTDDSCRTVSRIYSGTGSGRLRADRATGLGEIRVAGR